MKNKPTRHKEFNTFKFQPFAERISNIDIDIFHRIGHENEVESEDSECYFHHSIENWSILNLTESFERFKKELQPHKVVTLPQLIFEKERVVEVLLKHLKVKDPSSLQPLLDLLVALVKDLREDFYEYYESCFEVLIDCLNTKDAEQLEWTFTCLAYLFKFLWRPLLKDITTVFNMLLPLLSNSRPDYIHSFAAGSFAFVARKVKDWPTFLSHILRTVKVTKDGIDGCAKLFFEIIHGVSGQFHSCSQTVFPYLVHSLGNSKCPQRVLFEILEKVVENIVSNIREEKNRLLWDTLVGRSKVLLENWKSSRGGELSSELELVLQLLGQSIEFKNGRSLQDHTPIIGIIFNILNNHEIGDHVIQTTIKIAILLLLSKNVKLSQEDTSATIRKILTLPQQSILLYFVENVASFASFEALVLPIFRDHCVKTNLNDETLSVLTKLILKKSPLCQNGINLSKWAKYPVNLSLDSAFLDNLNSSDCDIFVATLVVLPHLKLTQYDRAETILTNKVTELLFKIENYKNGAAIDTSSELRKVLFVLNNTVETLIHLNSLQFLCENFDKIIDSLAPLAVKEYLWTLNVIDLLVTALRDRPQIANMATLLKLNTHLASGFNSPHHEIRLVTAHLYSLFEDLPEFDLTHSSDPDVPKEEFRVFSLCFKVESVDAHVQTYRDQLRSLEKFNFDKPQIIMCNKTMFKTVPLRYLCGILYINFKLLWEPILEIIETHAHGLDVEEFWAVFGEELRSVVSKIHNGVVADDNEMTVPNPQWSFLNDLFETSGKLKSGPDFVNYRLLLWKGLNTFANIAEAKTRDVSELFLDFMENEYTKNNSAVATNCNIKQNSVEETNSEESVKNNEVPEKPKKGKSNLQLLQNSLSVFSKVRSPKSMYREPELSKLYFDLLLHKNAEVQKIALDCIMTYKHKFLTSYKDHLYNLIHDKKFKEELATFHIGKEDGTLQEEHRNDLIPFIIRIVFSKMTIKNGIRTGGKSSSQLRRNLVLRFLAGCEEKEMLTFSKMAFQYYTEYLHDDPEVMIDELGKIISLENFVPPKRLQSSLNLLNVILDQFGGLMGNELLTFILKVVLMIGGLLKIAFSQLSEVHSGYWAILRSLRSSAINIVDRFFGQFDRYPWTNEQISIIFKVFVWPYLDKLNTEGIHSPTALLKLFHQWGSNPCYFPLLVKKHEDNREDQIVLTNVIQLLLNRKSKITVTNMIEEIIEKLLTLQTAEEDLQLLIPTDNPPLPKNILDRIKVDHKLNYGSCILLPHVPSILEKIKHKLEMKNERLNQRELFILSRISELIWEGDLSDSTLKLLLPLVLKRCSAGEEVVSQLLTTVSNLLRNVGNPRMHLKQITPIFGTVGYASGRKLLLHILRIVGTKREIELIEGLNAFDSKWVDQPDFQKRHDTFKELQKAIEEEKIDLELGILLIYNCFYLLKHERDLSLRENSSHSIKQLLPFLIRRNPKCVDYILNETVFTLIRDGMRDKGDYRQDCILILGHLSRESSDSHVILRDLNRYTNKHDLEVDFFENITHLQLHRHTRALLKFCSVTRDLTTCPNVRTLTQFILPLASFYLCNEKYVGKNSVIDASVECIETICRILPWHQYESLLKFYLAKLQKNIEYQKQLVRVTVAILDAFHYDLRKANVVTDRKLGRSEEEKAVTRKEGDEILEDESKIEDISIEDYEKSEIEDLGDEPVLEAVREEDEEEGNMHIQDDLKICKKISVLCKSTATRISMSIQNVLLPQLHRALAEFTRYDASHKINRKKTSLEREEEDLLRVPISLALVKLLRRLPEEILDANLPGIFMKMCTFLKSHLESVRRVARETLQKIMESLGPAYMPLLLAEMTPLLNRGFQVHVLVFTVHAVLRCLQPMYKPTDVDKVLLTVLQLCQADLFGSISEEKEVAKIGVKTSEAKATKSFDTLQILAQYITDKCLTDLILPIKNVLQNSYSFKTVHKAQECLRHVALGLVDNGFVETRSLLIFAYGTASESIPELVSKEKHQPNEKEEKKKPEKVDCFIIPKSPVGRSGARVSNVRSSTKTNSHLLVEFGLRLCHVMLKREKLKDEEFRPYLDPFVDIFKNCLTSKHAKLSTLTLQCLSWVMKYELPSMKDNVKSITEDMFSILHKYASAGLSKGDNFDLVTAAFKAMAVLVRDVKYHTIDVDQLKILLLYAEQDMHDRDRQATAFNLLKAIIARRLIVAEIHEVMTRVAELSITSELSHVRVQSRAVFYQYMMEYPLGDKLEKHLSFYLSQMSYEMQFGRESALEMIGSLISSFPLKTLKTHCGALFVTLGARLVNDEVPECRKQASNCLSSLLTRLTKKDKDDLFDIVVLWFKDKKTAHRRLAAQLCGIFISVEKSSFEPRLPSLFSLIMEQFALKEEDEDEETKRIKDHHLFQVLQMLLKLCTNCSSFLQMKEIGDLSTQIQSLLGYPHDWVRLAAAQFLGFVLAATDVEELGQLVATNKTGGSGYLHKDPVENVKALTLDLCDQLQPGVVKTELAEQVIKNLVFVTRVLEKVPDDAKINLLWLTKRMRKIVNSEVVTAPGSVVLRTEVFKWIAAAGTVLEAQSVSSVFSHLLAPLVREMITTAENNAPLRQLSKEVGVILKKKVGVEAYTKTLSNLQQILSSKRAERKRSRTQLAVTDSESYARKKIKRHEKKKEVKKRKLHEMKGKKVIFKKRKVVDMDPEAEVL